MATHSTKKSTKQTPKAAETPEVRDDITLERPITEANRISDRINRRLTQAKGLCALIGAADMDREIFNNDDLQAAVWGVHDLIENIESDYEECYTIAKKEMMKTEARHG